MINQAGRHLLQIEIDDGIRTDDHRIIAFIEGGDDLRKRLFIGVEIIGIQLHGIFAAMFGIDGFVPAAADAEVLARWKVMNQAVVAARKLGEYLRRPICRMIVDDDDVEGECRLLCERAAHGFGNRALAVAHGNDHRCAHCKARRACRTRLELRREVSARALQMTGGDGFHLNLNLAPARINVIELLVAGLAQVARDARVKQLWNAQRL